MKEIELTAIKDLVRFYNNYIENGINDIIKEQAKEIETQYLNTSPLVSEFITQAIGRLVDFYAPTGIKPPTKEQAEEIIKKLDKRKKEIKK